MSAALSFRSVGKAPRATRKQMNSHLLKPAATIRAYCFASGHIEFGKRIPSGALPIALAKEEQALRDFIEPLARRGYSTELVNGRPTKVAGSETLLVPGLPEAPDQGAALTAFQAWLSWISRKPPVGVTVMGGRAR